MLNFRGFPSKFLKYCFHGCIRSSWLVAFSLTFVVIFLLLTSFTVCHAIIDCVSPTESLILLIWFCMYSVRSFRYRLANWFCAFLSFRALILLGFLLLHLEAVFSSVRFLKITNVSYVTLTLGLCLLGMHSAAASKWALTKLSYSSFGVGVFDSSCSASNLFLCIFISNMPVVRQEPVIVDGGCCSGRFVDLVVCLPWRFGNRRTHPQKRNMPRNSMRYFSISYS